MGIMASEAAPARVCRRFTPVPADVRDRILSERPTPEAMADAERCLPALWEMECRAADRPVSGPTEVKVMAWNLQQGHFPGPAADILANAGADLVLLSEVDVGLHRTGQRHVAAEMRDRLGEEYGYGLGVEFYELLPTDNPFASPGTPTVNSVGFHCNGWLSRLPVSRPFLVRLRKEADWFVAPRRNQRRVGSRAAVAATFSLGTVELVAAAVHLESDADAAGRKRQMRDFLEAMDRYAESRPVILGGDFNAGARQPGFDYRAEGLFAVAEEYGYDWKRCNTLQPTSRRSLVVNAGQQNEARYDWFFAKGIETRSPGVVPAVDGEGRPISDHDAITLTLLSPR